MRRYAVAFLFFVLPLQSIQAEAGAAPQRFVEGVHYERLDSPVATQDDSKVEVVEMFSYVCVHCFNFEPYIQDWKSKQPEHVDFRAVPAIFNADWERLAQAFYTAETLGVTDKVHERLFRGIHAFQEDIRQPEVLAPLFEELGGVSEQDFNSTFGSFSVRGRVQQAKALVRAYRVTGVPAMVINGKYRTNGRMAGNNATMLEVVDFLVEKERASAAVASR